MLFRNAVCAAQNAQNVVYEIIKAQFVEITQINNSLLLFSQIISTKMWKFTESNKVKTVIT